MFIPQAGTGRAKGGEEFWVYVSQPAVRRCIDDLAQTHEAPFERSVLVVGRIHEDVKGSFGHMGQYRAAIQLERVLSGLSCR